MKENLINTTKVGEDFSRHANTGCLPVHNNMKCLTIISISVYNLYFHRQMLRELIPGDLLKIQNSAEWKRTIIAAYNQDTGRLCVIYSKPFVYVRILLQA